MSSIKKLYSVDAVRRKAHRRLPTMVSDFLEGGALDEVTLRRNREAYEQAALKQRVMVDVSRSDTRTVVLGTEFDVPLAVSPMGLLTVLHPEADAAVASAAAHAGSLFIHSPWSGVSLEEAHERGQGRVWSQIAFWEDRQVTGGHISKAKNLGIDTLIVAGDIALSSKRERDIVHGTSMPPKPPLKDVFNVALHPGWVLRWLAGRPMTWGTYTIDGKPIRMRQMDPWMEQQESLTATWADIADLRARWDGRLAVKGIMCAEDALEAINIGADAVYVSNHGGRQFDGQPSTLEMLPQIADAVNGRAEIIIDSGVRRGSDVVTALSMGADLVAAGRPFAYGLAAGAEAGVARVFEIFEDELRTALGFVGANELVELGPHRLSGMNPAATLLEAESR